MYSTRKRYGAVGPAQQKPTKRLAANMACIMAFIFSGDVVVKKISPPRGEKYEKFAEPK